MDVTEFLTLASDFQWQLQCVQGHNVVREVREIKPCAPTHTRVDTIHTILRLCLPASVFGPRSKENTELSSPFGP
jgi:hypothetical protein